MKKLSSMDSYPNIIGVAYKRKEDKIGSRVLVLEVFNSLIVGSNSLVIMFR